MKILKFIASWKLWVSLILTIVISYGLLEGTFLWLNAYTNHGVQVEVPNLKDVTLDQAIVKLDESDLSYEIDTSKYDPKYKSYQILDIYPLMGSNVKKGRRVFIRANAKTWKPVAVPNIIGKYKYIAFSQLNLVGLKVSDTIYEPSLAVNTVIRLLYKGKEVQPGVSLPRFSSLSIVLAKGLAKNVSVPSFIGLDEEIAKNMITENLFTVGSIIYDDPDNKSNARIYYQIPAPASTFDQGQSIDLYLSSKPLDQLKEKIQNLDATFNKKFLGGDSLNEVYEVTPEPVHLHKPVEQPTPNPSPAAATPSPKPNKPKEGTSPSNNKPKPKEEPRKPNRVIIE